MKVQDREFPMCEGPTHPDTGEPGMNARKSPSCQWQQLRELPSPKSPPSFDSLRISRTCETATPVIEARFTTFRPPHASFCCILGRKLRKKSHSGRKGSAFFGASPQRTLHFDSCNLAVKASRQRYFATQWSCSTG